MGDVRCSPSVVEAHHSLGTPLQVGNEEADAREQLARVPLHFGNHAPGALPGLRL
jgi:hypothetical protein